MTHEQETPFNEDAIEAIAADWLVERDEGFLPGRAEEFAAWCQLDPRHRAAVTQLEATHRLLSQLPQLRDDAQLSRRLEEMMRPAPARVIPFPRWAMAAAAAALVVLATALWWPARSPDFQQQFVTAPGGASRVRLPDESRVELEGNTAVVVSYSARQRNLELTRGEANFIVAREVARPFVVAAGRVRVRAVGTIFKVRHDARAIEVAVSEGTVEVSRPRAGQAELVVSTLIGGQSLELPPDGTEPSAITSTPATTAQPFERLVFNGTPLGKVVEEFNRRNALKLVLEDAELANRPVGGEFESDKPEAFVFMLEAGGEISSARADGSTIVLRKRN